ncbi:MAG TPA: response regulator transcription factor [Planctomycetaceae bacterium]|nr:response regulator transcription factor [Planctomycetaceae bacterium]
MGRTVNFLVRETMRILVVEDNQDLASNLRRGLQESGYAVDVAHSCEAGRSMALTGVHSLLLIDRMLPGGDGLDLLRRVRAEGITAPTIFLTARGEVPERIAGLQAGADDYVSKPFSFAELLARIQVVLRRGSVVTSRVLQVADLTLDPDARTVTRAHTPIELTARQFTLLQFLMSRAGQVVTRSMLLEHVWSFEFDGMSNVVDVHINRLRNKVDRGFDRPLIHTLRGVGYVLREE